MRFGAGVGRRLAAVSLIIPLSGIPLVHGQTVRPAGTLSGRIFLSDGLTPRGGVVVKAANLATSQVFSSGATDKSGRYGFPQLPSGQYQVAVEANEGMYVNQQAVPVVPGRKTLFSLALSPNRQDQPPPAEPPPAEPPPAEPPPAETPKPEEAKPEEPKTPEKPAEESKKKGGDGFWRSGWGVAVALGGGAIVLGLLADSLTSDEEQVAQPPSQSTP